MVDNYLDVERVHLKKLERIRSHYPIVFLSVGMNLGSVEPPGS
jgi:uncharacterized protein (UPF0276 family)